MNEKQYKYNTFFPFDTMPKRGLCRRAVSVCLSVRLSRSCILWKRVNASSFFFTIGYSTPFYCFPTKHYGTYYDGSSNAGWVWKNQYFRLSHFIARY